MKKILIDLNIILDFLNKRNFCREAARLIDLCVEKKVHGYMCAHEITTLSYFLMKEQKDKVKVIHIITALMDILNIIPVDELVLREALLSPISDYEDAVIEISARENNLDYIISRNIADFKKARIPAITPEQFFLLESQSLY